MGKKRKKKGRREKIEKTGKIMFNEGRIMDEDGKLIKKNGVK